MGLGIRGSHVLDEACESTWKAYIPIHACGGVIEPHGCIDPHKNRQNAK